MDLNHTNKFFARNLNVKSLKKHYHDFFKFYSFRSNVLFYKNLNISYNFIPKVACTTLKYSLGIANGTLLPWENPHFDRVNECICLSQAIHSSATKLVVLRNPYTRIVSAYLNKIADPVEWFAIDLTSQALSELRGIDATRVQDVIQSGQTLSFQEFILFLSQREDMVLDTHWRSQISMLAFEEYDVTLDFDRLEETWAKSQLSWIPLVSNRPHASDLLDMPKTEIISDNAVHLSTLHGKELLNILSASENRPSKMDFFNDPKLKEVFESRFYDDVLLYKSSFFRE